MIRASRKRNDVSGLYQALVQHRIHQDQLLWSRIQIMHAIQVGVIASVSYLYFVREHSLLGGSLLIGAGVLTVFLFFLILGDYADMKVNETIMNKLAKRLLPLWMGCEVRWTDKCVWHRKVFRGALKGHYMIYASVILFVVVDFVFGTLLLSGLVVFG